MGHNRAGDVVKARMRRRRKEERRLAARDSSPEGAKKTVADKPGTTVKAGDTAR
jgi:hypothetical protein